MIVGMGLAQRRARELRLPGHLPLFLALHPLQHDRRLAGRPLQQAADHHWTKVMEIGAMALATAGLTPIHSHAFAARARPGRHAGRALRAIKVWAAPRTASRETPFLGQRRHRTRHLPRHHSRHGHRRGDGRALPWTRSLCRLRSAGAGGCDGFATVWASIAFRLPRRRSSSGSTSSATCGSRSDSCGETALLCSPSLATLISGSSARCCSQPSLSTGRMYCTSGRQKPAT